MGTQPTDQSRSVFHRHRPRLRLAFIVLCSLFAPLGDPIDTLHASHVVWDTHHDVFGMAGALANAILGGDFRSGSPVELATGNLKLSQLDIHIAGRGPNLVHARTYHSRYESDGPLGYGWTFPYSQQVFEVTDGKATYAYLVEGPGRYVRFKQLADATYESPLGTPFNLTKESNREFVVGAPGLTSRRFSKTGALQSIRDANGNVLSLSYRDDFLTTVTDASGRKLTFVRGPDGRIASVRDPAGRTHSYGYDSNGNLESVANPLGQVTRYRYDPSHNLIEIIDAKGNSSNQLTYDEQDRVATYSQHEERFTLNYYPQAYKTEKTDSEGNTWTYSYDQTGKIYSTTDPLGGVRAISFDESGQPTGYTNELGASVSIAYDPNGRISEVQDPLSHGASLSYHPSLHRAAAMTLPNGARLEYAYDPRGNLLEVSDAINRKTSLVYDSRGQLTTATAANGASTAYRYDQYGYVAEVKDTLDRTTKFSHDSVGNLLSVTNAKGHVTRYEYDRLDRLVRVIAPSQDATSFEYDENGNTSAVTNANSQTLRFTFDKFNRLATEVDAVGKQTSYGYDKFGRLKVKTTRNGDTTSFAYDVLGRLIEKQTADNVVRYSYDSVGNLRTIIDADSSLEYRYDQAGRIVAEVTHESGSQPATVVGYQYDESGNRLSCSDPLGGVVNFRYDSVGRLIHQTGATGDSFEFSYDANQRQVGIKSPTGVSSQFSYDQAGRLAEIRHSAGTRTLASRRVAYDDVDNRISVQDDSDLVRYQYDPAGQLTSVDGAGQRERYSFDSIGNRRSSHISSTYRYDAANRLLEDDVYVYDYDANGSLVSKRNKSTNAQTGFRYDIEGRLTQIDFPDGSEATYRYDGLGRRVEKTVRGQTERYIYQGEDVLLELDGNNQVNARYLHTVGLDNPLSVERSGTQSYFLKGTLGTIAAVTNSNGDVTANYTYGAFGKQLQPSSSLPLGLAGLRLDHESGLYYVRARHYDPTTGRFLQEDPSGLNGGINLYAYAANNPIAYVDPLGLAPLPDSLMDAIHNALDMLGLAPGLGEIFDLLNAALYAGQGDMLNAALSGAAAVPLLGMAAIGGKMAAKGAAKLGGHGGDIAAPFSRILGQSSRQLQRKFKHASDFGVPGNYSKSNAGAFSGALNRHINSPGTQAIQGSYRGDAATHFFDPASGLNVVADPAGNFISGWMLSPSQAWNVLNRGSL